MSPKIALLIDAENISYQSVPHILKEVPLYGQLVLKAAYADWQNPTLQTWHEVALRNNFKIRHQANPARIKNASDMKLMMDAVEVLYGIRTRIDIFCLVTNDADFVPLCHRIHEAKRQVIGMGCKHAAEVFIRECDRFIFIPNGSSAPQVATSLSVESRPIDPTLSSPTITVASIPKSSVSSSSPEMIPSQPFVIVTSSLPKIRKLLTKAFALCPQDEEGWVLLTRIGDALRQIHPDFKTNSYGHPTLSKLLESLPDFVQIKGNESVVWTRLRSHSVSKPIDLSSLRKSVVDSFAAVPWNIEGWVTLSALGNAIRRLEPGFQAKNHGYNDLTTLLQSMQDCVELKVEGSIKSARLKNRAVPSRG